MGVVQKIVSAVRVQDLILVLVCILSIYLLRARDSFVLQPAWRQELNPLAYDNGRFPAREEWLPSPVVTDLDGDGAVEVVLVTADRELQVSRVPDRNQTELRLPDLVSLSSTKLQTREHDDPRSGRPVALETGYIVPSKSKTVARMQVIVLLLDDWTVLCYDSHLNLVWNRTLMNISHSGHYAVKAVGILITPHPLQKNDTGSVIVGGSFRHTDHESWLKSLNPDESYDGPPPQNEPADDIYTHFSTFALSGSDGSVRWHHLPGDFEQKFLKDVEHSRMHWKLRLKRGKWHSGEVHWSKYSENLIKHMPHSWRNIQDTKFDLSDLQKAGVVSSKVKQHRAFEELAPLQDIVDFDTEHLVGRQYGGLTPHSRHEHIKHPTAVVIHHDGGLEVLNVHTGHPLTHLNLETKGRPVTFVDLNEDGAVEEVCANFVLRCQAEASTVQPRPKAVFTGPLCESPFWWGGVSLSNLFYTPEAVSEDTHLAVSPVLVKSIAKSRGIFRHLWGQALPSERKGYDSIFLTSTGQLTSYSPSGHPNWQVVVPASWSAIAFKAETENAFAASRNGEVYFNSFQPSMTPFAPQLYGKQSLLLVSGWDAIAVVDLREGFVMGHHSLPCQPIRAPLTADFNGDGLTDFIVSCPDAYIGFEIHKASSMTYSIMIAVGVILCMALIVWCCQQEPDDG